MFGETLAVLVDRERRRLGDPPRFTLVEAGAGGLAGGAAARSGGRAGRGVWSRPHRQHGGRLNGGEGRGFAGAAGTELSGGGDRQRAARQPPQRHGGADPTGWDEWPVGENGGVLALMTAQARPEVASWADRFAGPVTTGSIVEVQLAAGAWLESALRLLEAGAVVVIDYGDTAEGLPAPCPGHHPYLSPTTSVPIRWTSPVPPTSRPMSTSRAVAVAEEAGAAVEIHRQDDFLSGLGLRTRLSELRHHELELARPTMPWHGSGSGHAAPRRKHCSIPAGWATSGSWSPGWGTSRPVPASHGHEADRNGAGYRCRAGRLRRRRSRRVYADRRGDHHERDHHRAAADNRPTRPSLPQRRRFPPW